MSGRRGAAAGSQPQPPARPPARPALARPTLARPTLAGLALAAYPPDWRDRYGDELGLLVSDLRAHGRRPVPMALDLLRGAAAAWVGYKKGSAMSERSRNALITVLWCWAAYGVTAAFFGKDLGITPNRAAASQLAVTHPAIPDAYHVLIGVGVSGIAATTFAAAAFAYEAVRYAREQHQNKTFALMAVPVLSAAVWLAGWHFISNGHPTAGRLSVALTWLLLGLAGLAASIQAVVRIVRTTEFSRTTWRIGAAASAAVTAAMLTGLGAVIVWGIAYRTATAHPGDATGWLAVTAILAASTARAAMALIGSRRASTPEPAAAAI
ncbi:MAG TPA: hypothetical protein VF843_02500 [Streptosporangiaceae bacterium]